MNSLIASLTEIARENIDLFAYAGLGMYNLDIHTEEIFTHRPNTDTPYHPISIFQIYPYEEKDCYGCTYILAYYQYNDTDYDNDCYEFESLTMEEQIAIYNSVVRTINRRNNKDIYTEYEY